jgi:hypothetical protein
MTALVMGRAAAAPGTRSLVLSRSARRVKTARSARARLADLAAAAAALVGIAAWGSGLLLIAGG